MFSFFFPLFLISWYVFPLFWLLALLSELHEVCDKRISELLGMIRCNKINNKIFMYRLYFKY